MNNKCYEYKKFKYNDGIFKNIDATYIINLKNNGRLPHIKNQLKKYHPSDITYIAFNKGYRKCKKDESITNSALDLIDANRNILNHSIENKHDTILILEDDFEFDKKVKIKIHRNNIDEFISENIRNKFIYYLGTLPVIKSYSKNNHQHIYASAGTHACIYSKAMKHNLLSNIENQSDWDGYVTKYPFSQYSYFIPLCYQLFPETENQKSWADHIPIIGSSYRYILINTLKSLKLDTQVQPGYDIMYKSSEIIFTLIIIAFLIIIYKLLKKNIMSLINEYK
tara:strand:- start:103 stop:945 length:843 start_codon:yes stop_codon:yes gene_type:complete